MIHAIVVDHKGAWGNHYNWIEGNMGWENFAANEGYTQLGI